MDVWRNGMEIVDQQGFSTTNQYHMNFLIDNLVDEVYRLKKMILGQQKGILPGFEVPRKYFVHDFDILKAEFRVLC